MGYPCALGMATPLAIVRTSGEAAQRGILMRSGEAFHLLGRVDTFVLDKTGTVTESRPHLVACRTLGMPEEELLRLAASAERPSEHPLARAVVDGAAARGLALPDPADFAAHPGRGVEARVEGRWVLAGSATFLHARGVDATSLLSVARELQDRGQTTVLVAVDGRPTGVLGIEDPLKRDAAETVGEFRRRGLRIVLLTGDGRRTAQAVAQDAGIEEVLSEVLPGHKAEVVRKLQGEGRRMAMVGDGINDAPALMQADVGVAIGAGADIAVDAADVVLVSGRLGALVDAVELAKRSYGLTVGNVAVALAFKRAGLSLREVAEVFRLRDRGESPCGHVRDWLDRKLAEVEDQLRALRGWREELRHLRRRADGADPQAPCICPILEDAGAGSAGSGA